MSDKIYFQWQNPILRETIYPVRDMKLRHFLLYYHEIDLWEKYKAKKDLPVDKFPKEKEEFLAAQEKSIANAYDVEDALKQYFKKDAPPIVTKPGAEDKADVQRLRQLLDNLRADFRAFFKADDGGAESGQEQESAGVVEEITGRQMMGDLDIQRSRDRKEKIFVAMRVADWEQHLKGFKQRLARKQTFIDFSDPKPANLDDLKADRDTLKDSLVPMMEEELENLKELVAAQNKLEKRKAEFASRVAKKIAERHLVLKDLLPKREEIAKGESRQRELERELARVVRPPTVAGVMEFFQVDLYAKIDKYLRDANTHEILIDVVRIHLRSAIKDDDGSSYTGFVKLVTQWLAKNQGSGKVDPAWIVQRINNFGARFLEAEKRLDRTIASLESGIPSMRAVANSLVDNQERAIEESKIGDRLQVIGILADSKLRDMLRDQWEHFDELQYAFRFTFPTRAGPPNRTRAQVKIDLNNALRKLDQTKKSAASLEKQLDQIDEALCIKREKYLKEFIVERTLTLKEDIVPFLADKYYSELLKLDHDQLLLAVFHRFWQEPERFPLWLQYMVVHFSGMRYASAHGSWADPRDLLLSLRTSDIQSSIEKEMANIKTNGLLDASCQERVATYEPLKTAIEDSAAADSLPAYARVAAQDSRFIRRFQGYYKAQLTSAIESKRYKALFDLRVDEEGCEIQAMSTEDVLEELTALRAERQFPEWMWKEIVKLTDLRLTEVDSKEWETLTAADQAERLSNKDKKMAEYREIMNKWKSENLTGWREEHERSNRLIVTRAVCNEVAEHIQHLRGLVAAAGLTQKPFWYKGAEDRYWETKRTTGRSRVGGRQSDPHPYFVRARDRGTGRHTFEVGASILWLRFVNDSPNEWRIAKPMATREGDELVDRKYRGYAPDSGNWAYTMGEPVIRTRQKRGPKGKPIGPKETQYLRWMHEATVATVADTAEGKVVLTFETALPFEDPSVSTIGVFKRYLNDLNSDQGEDGYNPAFVGFMPEKERSEQDVQSMKEMLDWNHIFLKEVVTPRQLQEFQTRYILNHKPAAPTVQFLNRPEEDKPAPVMALKPLREYEAWIDRLAADPNSNLFRVKKWGHIRKGELDVNVIGKTNFQAVSVYNDKTGFGAVSNFIYILRDDIDRLRELQVDDEYAKKQKDWRSQKMSWLCRHRGSIYMFDNRKDSWMRSPRIRWGTLVLGGNLVQVTGYKRLKLKGKKRVADMAVLAGFRKADWDRPLDDLLAEGLVHRCFCAYKNNQFGDSPQGIVYSPFYSLLDWDFGGAVAPRELYIPVEDLYKPKLST